jgi:nucleotide-binding universal stress UspA family protein
MYKTILVPLDSSITAQRGLREAIGLARLLGAKLALLHVVNTVVMASEAAAANTAELLDSRRTAGADLLAEAQRQARGEGVVAETVLVDAVDGRIDATVLEQVRQMAADLIVMGTHGRAGLARLVLGSDAELVVRGSPVPVLLVPGPATP